MNPTQETRQCRLLVISYHYPPDGSVGGLRWAGLARYLVHHGWEVHVVTASPQPRNARVAGVHVHICRRARTLNDLYNAVARHLRKPAPPPAAPGRRTEPSSPQALGPLGRIRREIAASLGFPDYARGWILRSAWKARALLDRMAFDAVVTSGPPHSAHLAGVLATLGRPEALSLDMRDPWADLLREGWGKSLFNSALARSAIPRLERLAFRRARQVITNTAEFAETLRRSHPELSVAFLPNGIDPERLPALPVERFDGLSIAYVGTLYAGRDLSPVLEALRRFLDRHPAARACTRLRVAGHQVAGHGARFREQVTAANLMDVVEIRGVLPSGEALDLLNRSHLALVLAQDQPMQIPAKLYECMGLQVPTLVIAEAASAAGREARRIGAMAVEATDIEGIRSLLEDLWRGDYHARIPPSAPIDYPGLAVQLNHLLRSTHAGGAEPHQIALHEPPVASSVDVP